MKDVADPKQNQKPFENSIKVRRTWCYADSLLFEDPDWITKIKTFKITRVKLLKTFKI